MSFWRNMFSKNSSIVQVRTSIETDAVAKVSGQRSPDGKSVYLVGGPADDPHEQWQGSFPPPGYVDSDPRLGDLCTISDGTVYRRARIVACGKAEVVVRAEYSYRNEAYSQRSNGCYVQKGLGADGPRLYFGIVATNLKSMKQWYTDRDLAGGWTI
jgi:hypothetical protein